MTDTHLREEIVRIGRLMHQFEFVDGSAGNISARLDENRILATPSGLPKGFLTPDQLIITDLNGKVLPPSPAHLKPTSELLMHLEAYKQRADVMGVVHAHPITAVALTIAGIPLTDCIIPESVVILGPIPTTPYANPASAENQAAISDLIKYHDGLMLAYHGSLTVGKSAWDAYMKLETLEHTAKIIAQARVLGGTPVLPPHQVEKLIEARHKLGLTRPNDDELFCKYCNVTHARGKYISEEALVELIAEEVVKAIGK